MSTLEVGNLRVTVVTAIGLYKSDYLRFPDPFAIITVNGEQTCRTSVIEKTITPYWDESFILKANKDDVLIIRIFDQKKFQKKEQGFLGVVKVRIGPVMDPNVGSDKRITKDLQISKSGGLVSHGKLTVNLSTNLSSPADRPPQHSGSAPSLLSERRVEAASVIYPAAISRESHATHRPSIEQAYITLGNTSTSSMTSSISDRSLSSRSITSEDAILAWNRRFANPQVHLQQNDPAPFDTVRRLGGGGIGIVFETKLGGVALALKRTYARGLTPDHLNEFRILSRITERRHKHVVELIGSYIHKQKGTYELGLLIWPVARCDLAVFLQDVDSLGQWIEQASRGSPITESVDLDSAVIESLSAITGIDGPWTSKSALDKNATHLYELSLGTLRSRLGCIANAVAWIHQQGIRHKDLKPSQILLSPEGLWLTDFGWSKDISEQAHSTTSGGDNITLKYQSPERAHRQACGRPEDIFALGCIFLEMTYQLAKPMLHSEEFSAPWQQKGWFFQANLDQVQPILKSLKKALYESGHGFLLPKLIVGMLALNPDDRPSVDEVVDRLSTGSYFGQCCTPALGIRLSNFGNDPQSQSSVINHNVQHDLAPTYCGGLVPTVPTDSQQLLSLSTAASVSSSNISESHHTHRQVTHAPSQFQNYNISTNPTTRDIPSGYSREIRAQQTYLGANINPNLSNMGETSSRLSTHTLLAPVDASGNILGPGAGPISRYNYQDPTESTAPRFKEQSLDFSSSHSNVANSSLPKMAPAVLQDTTYDAGFNRSPSASSSGPITTIPRERSRKLFKKMTNALNGLDHQINGLINNDKTGRSFVASGVIPLSGVAKALNGAANKQM